jgi:hypothetical protein
MYRSTYRSRMVALFIAALAASLLLAVPAAQARSQSGGVSWIDGKNTPYFQSPTNPSYHTQLIDDPIKPGWWRQGWGNTTDVEFYIYPGGLAQDEYPGMLYVIDRDPGRLPGGAINRQYITTSTPNAYFRSVKIGPLLEDTADMYGIWAGRPTGLTTSLYPGAATYPFEGRWWVHYWLFNQWGFARAHDFNDPADVAEYGSATQEYCSRVATFGLDFTPPAKVSNVTATRVATSTVPGFDGWTPQNRVLVKWDYRDYDALAGTAYFRVYVDGTCVVPGDLDLDTPMDAGSKGVPWYGTNVPENMNGEDTGAGYVTLEDLTPGIHLIQVTAVDRACNEGPVSDAVVVQLNPGYPTVQIVSPETAAQAMSSPTLLSAVAGSGLDIAAISFNVDGTDVGTVYPRSGDGTVVAGAVLTRLSSTSTALHTLTVSATDISGKTSLSQRTFRVDANEPVSPLDFQTPQVTGGLGGVSSTNPYQPDVAETFWREMWGNSPLPNFTLSTPSHSTTEMATLYYLVDRSPMTGISPTDPSSYYSSVHPAGTETLNSIDQWGVLEDDPTLSGLTQYPGKALDPVEGIWYWHLLYINGAGKSSPMYDLAYGVDVTKPNKVTGVRAYRSNTATTTLSTWVSQSRVHMRWDNLQQDALSGTAYYRIYDGSTCVVPGETDLKTPTSGTLGVPWYVAGRTSSSITLEELSAGKHDLTITAVDRAGNESTKSSKVTVMLDPDTPTISITSPGLDEEVPRSPLFSVDATDGAGVASVRYYVDDKLVGTVTKAPFSLQPNLSSFADGQHTLKAVVTDMFGASGQTSMRPHTAFATQTFILDRTLPKFSSFKITSKGRKATVTFVPSESGDAKFTLYGTGGNFSTTSVTKAVTGGKKYSLSITVPSDRGTASQTATIKPKYKLAMTDSVGNASSPSKTGRVTITYYKLVKTGPDSVKVVYY